MLLFFPHLLKIYPGHLKSRRLLRGLVKLFSQKLWKILLEDQLNWKLIFQGTEPTHSHEKLVSVCIEFIILVINAIKGCSSCTAISFLLYSYVWTFFIQSM